MSLVATPFPRQSTAAGDLLKKWCPTCLQNWNQTCSAAIKSYKPIEIHRAPTDQPIISWFTHQQMKSWDLPKLPKPFQQTTQCPPWKHRSQKILTSLHWEEKKNRNFPKKNLRRSIVHPLSLLFIFFWRGNCFFPMAITPAAVCAANRASLVFQPHGRQQVAVKTWLHLHVFLIVKHLHSTNYIDRSKRESWNQSAILYQTKRGMGNPAWQ